MPHIDPEQLALLALGEPAADAGAPNHLAACPVCRDGLRDLRAVVDLGREVGTEASTEPVPPPRRVWEGIAAELGSELHSTSPVAVATARPSAAPAATFAPRGTNARGDEPAGAPVIRLDARRSRRRTLLAAAAACVAGLAVGAAATLGITGLREPADSTVTTAPPPPSTVLASARLTAVGAAADATGTARVVRTSDRVELAVDTRNLPPVDGYYEAWMYVPDTQKMQSMGAVEPGTVTRFRVPDGLAISEWAGINISVEPLDGNPNHSARSVLDGELRG